MSGLRSHDSQMRKSSEATPVPGKAICVAALPPTIRLRRHQIPMYLEFSYEVSLPLSVNDPIDRRGVLCNHVTHSFYFAPQPALTHLPNTATTQSTFVPLHFVHNVSARKALPYCLLVLHHLFPPHAVYPHAGHVRLFYERPGATHPRVPGAGLRGRRATSSPEQRKFKD